ncbi:TetR/AcrR family transcriptional regulator [Nakamurella aerolata]|uniref:TetR/AcrR family transcriptional regulator n=1 Tax=Nakamurella aerolata TaxID=1656892 RepID=A0A849A1A8_9ACTN|nr:TetR/AcrR family transcriptional regulator [Nakamurella aerolata]NNG34419.1 TetR/AcrR family transcriptional regulator [Nakamurella aerolata]
MRSVLTLQPVPLPVTTGAGERLLDAAEDLFYWRGIGAVGVDLVAETAGVTKRTLYQRFGSKSELACAYLQRRAHHWQALLLDTLSLTRDEERPLVVYDAAARWAEQNPRGCAFVNAWAEFGNTAHPVAAVVCDEKRWMRQLFRSLVSSKAKADHLQLLYEGAQVIASTLGDHAAYARAKKGARAVLAGNQPGRAPAAQPTRSTKG